MKGIDDSFSLWQYTSSFFPPNTGSTSSHPQQDHEHGDKNLFFRRKSEIFPLVNATSSFPSEKVRGRKRSTLKEKGKEGHRRRRRELL